MPFTNSGQETEQVPFLQPRSHAGQVEEEEVYLIYQTIKHQYTARQITKEETEIKHTACYMTTMYYTRNT